MENKILKICTDIRAITDEEIAQVRQIYEDQLSYNNPLKPETSGWQYELGLYNKNVFISPSFYGCWISAPASISFLRLRRASILTKLSI